MTRVLQHLNAEDYPHVNLDEISKRAGWTSYRYVEHRRTDGSWELGDTNTGRTVDPRRQQVQSIRGFGAVDPLWDRREEAAAYAHEMRAFA